MTKVLNAQALRRFLAVVLAALLVAALVPQLSPAYGDDAAATGDAATLPADDAAADESDDSADANGGVEDDNPASDEGAPDGAGTAEGDGASDEGASDDEAAAAPDDGNGVASEDVFDGEVADTAAPAGTADGSGDDPAESREGASSPGNPEDSAEETDATSSDEPSEDVVNVADAVVAARTAVRQNYVYSTEGDYTLTIDGILTGTIEVSGGARLTLNGGGTINGAGAGRSVVTVTGPGSALMLNHDKKNLTITGGTGTRVNKPGRYENLKSYNAPYVAGGGILVQVDANGNGGASLDMRGGTITGNTANAGGGIFIDRTCSFLMDGGAVTGNTAKHYEGGGIFTAGNGDGRGSTHATIVSGSITGNTSETTFAWGGGGIFVENSGVLKLESALITANTAQGLGGGVSGCPHAKIGIGDITEGAAIYGNTATKKRQPSNPVLQRLETDSSLTEGKKIWSGDLYAYGYGGNSYSKDDFTAAKAMDFYCTKVSYVFGYDLGQSGDVAWTGYEAGPNGGRDVSIAKGEAFVTNDASLGLTSTKREGAVGGRSITITGNTSYTHGGGIGCNGSLLIGNLASAERYNPFSFSFKKNFANSAGDVLPVTEGQFSFTLYEKNGQGSYEPIGLTAVNDAKGTVSFKFEAELSRRFLAGLGNGQSKTVTLYVREDEKRTKDGIPIVYDERYHEVKITLTNHVSTAVVDPANSIRYTVHDPEVTSVVIDGAPASDFAIANTLDLRGSIVVDADKHYLGAGKAPAGAFSFTMRALRAPDDLGAVDLEALVRQGGSAVESDAGKVIDDGTSALTLTASNRAFNEDGAAKVVFPEIGYSWRGDGGDDATQSYWYRITEDSAADPTVYVLRVDVAKDDDCRSLVASVGAVYYADSLASTALTELTGDDAVVAFYNTDERLGAVAFSSYRVNAASGESMERRCLVDPKIFKQLEGRTLKGGEFSFQLVRATDDYEPTGEVISETTNDRYGMVDFDAAANVAGEGEEPSCLLFTQPGTYRYRVIEDASFERDPSIDYSGEVITFTAVVEEVDGALVATDMYYGRLVNGENVRDDNSIDPSWHPAITNQARPMDLAVRKTSELDRTQGLEGATYGLFMVNDSEQDDILLGSATSDADGWVYFEDVSLAEGNRYYFKEQAAPAGHTVSEFRSAYFFVERDAAAELGYVLRYADAAAPWAVAAEDGEAAGEPASSPATTGKDGALLFVYERDGGVSDEATEVAFNKLDTRTHEWVEGAKLSVREKESGRVVASWTSGAAPQVLEAVLNVDTVYVLREDEAPEGYERAADVEFSIDSYGNVEVLAGTENGNAELSDATITLYDTRIPVEEVVTENRERVREVPGEDERGTRPLARTGDTLAWGAIALVAVGSAALALAAGRRRRRGNHSR